MKEQFTKFLIKNNIGEISDEDVDRVEEIDKLLYENPDSHCAMKINRLMVESSALICRYSSLFDESNFDQVIAELVLYQAIIIYFG